MKYPIVYFIFMNLIAINSFDAMTPWDAFSKARNDYLDSRSDENFKTFKETANHLRRAKGYAFSWQDRELYNTLEKLLKEKDARTVAALRREEFQAQLLLTAQALKSQLPTEEEISAQRPIDQMEVGYWGKHFRDAQKAYNANKTPENQKTLQHMANIILKGSSRTYVRPDWKAKAESALTQIEADRRKS